MGSDVFITYADGTDVKEAFHDAKEEALAEYGHQDGYSGTISTKWGYTVLNPPLVQEFAFGLANKLLDEDDPRFSDKSGPAGAIPVIRDSREISVSGFSYLHDNDWRGDNQPALVEAVTPLVKLKRGEKIRWIRISGYSYDDRRSYGYSMTRVTTQMRTKCTATVCIEKSKSAMAKQAEPDGWVFFGWAPC